MKALQDLLDSSYLPHRGDSYNQTYVTPGTIDPAIPIDPESEITDDTTPMLKHTEDALFNRHGYDDLLDALFHVIHQPDYETAGPFTLGGKSQASLSQIANVTGVGSVYTLVNPFDTDAEFCVISAHFGAAGQAVLTRDPASALGPALTAFYDGGNYYRVIPFFAAGVTSFPMGIPVWFPFPASDTLYWAVNMTAANTDSGLVTLAIRRRINRHGRYELTIE